MRTKTHWILAASLLISTLAFAQEREEPILPAQANAIRSLAKEQGFTPAALNLYLTSEWGVPLYSLSRQDAVKVIRRFQSDNPPSIYIAETKKKTPSVVAPQRTERVAQSEVRRTAESVEPEPQEPEPILAEILEVGMSKRFHLVDGNIITGTITRIDDDVCTIETVDGLLKVPTKAILEETADITKKDDTRYVGPVLRETPEEIILRSIYGNVVVSKKDIREMDRYHGGQRVPWAEEKKTFYRGEAVLTDILNDPTAFPLGANTFYISGLSLGYGFTDRFMIRTKFGEDFAGDMNLHPIFQFYHRGTGVSEVAAAIGFHLFNDHPMETVVARYAKYIKVVDTLGISTLDQRSDIPVLETLAGEEEDKRRFYWESYIVLSSRRSLATGRGKMGWHIGIKTNSLMLYRNMLDTTFYSWDKSKDNPWVVKKDMIIPFRAWVAFEYDLSKRLKLMLNMWADNGHRYRRIDQVLEDYWTDGTPFHLDQTEGSYRTVDFDFGILYAFGESLRFGIHFQEPYFLLYWEFFEL